MNLTQTIKPEQKPEIVPVPLLINRMSLVQKTLPLLKASIYAEAAVNPALEVEDADIFEIVTSTDTEYVFDHSGKRTSQEDEDPNRMFLEGSVASSASLRDHLWSQLQLEHIPNADLEIGYLLINNLDDRGFHIEPPQEVVPETRADRVDALVRTIQHLDPIGTCVHDFRESLLIQAGMFPDVSDILYTIIENHLDDVQKNRFDRIAVRMGITRMEVQHAISILQKLDPFPGLRFSTDHTEPIVPELILRRRDGEFFVSYNDEEIPVLRVDETFLKTLNDTNPEVRAFAKEHVARAQTFISDVGWRNNNILRVGQAILEFQRDYFLKGKRYLAPLTLKDIAQALDLSASTISRLTKGKYMQTEWGVFELKHFFSNPVSLGGTDGKRHSKESVKEIIRDIIESRRKEDAKRPSDEKITQMLGARGINVSRRAVNKYRRELGHA